MVPLELGLKHLGSADYGDLHEGTRSFNCGAVGVLVKELKFLGDEWELDLVLGGTLLLPVGVLH